MLQSIPIQAGAAPEKPAPLRNPAADRALVAALNAGDLNAAAAAVGAGAYPNLTDRNGNNLGHLSAKAKHEAGLTAFLDAEGNPHTYNGDRLQVSRCAVLAKSPEMVRLLAARDGLSQAGWDGDTDLQEAIRAGTPACARALLVAGADPDAGMPPPLLLCAESDDAIIAEALLDAGADAGVCDDEGRNLIGVACLNDSPEMLRLGIERGLSVRHKAAGDNEPAHECARHRGSRCLPILCDAQADLNVRNADGDAPTHLFALYGSFANLKEAASRNADFDLKNDDGKSVAGVALHYGHADCLGLTLRCGADVPAFDKDGPQVPCSACNAVMASINPDHAGAILHRPLLLQSNAKAILGIVRWTPEQWDSFRTDYPDLAETHAEALGSNRSFVHSQSVAPPPVRQVEITPVTVPSL